MKNLHYKENLKQIRKDIIADIKDFCAGRELAFTHTLVYRDLNDQEFETFDRVSEKGVYIASPDYKNGGYDMNFEGFSMDALLAVHLELEAGEYEVFEGNGED